MYTQSKRKYKHLVFLSNVIIKDEMCAGVTINIRMIGDHTYDPNKGKLTSFLVRCWAINAPCH